MDTKGIVVGDEFVIPVIFFGLSLVEFVILADEDDVASCRIYGLEEENTLRVFEALQCASNSLRFLMEKPRLQELIAARIKELNEMESRGEEGNPPPPLTGVEDIPF